MPTTEPTAALPKDSKSAGGLGGNLFDRPVNERTDLQLIRRAIAEGWPISSETKKLVVDKMAHIIDKGRDNRNKIAASRVLVAADSVNARREATWEEAQKPTPQTNITTIIQQNVGSMPDDKLDQLCRLIDEVAPGALDGTASAGGTGEVPA